MAHHPPAAPPEQQSQKGPGDNHVAPADTGGSSKQDRKAEKAGDEESIRQNTTNHGYQQDR